MIHCDLERILFAGETIPSVAMQNGYLREWGHHRPGVPLGSLRLAGALPQASQVRGYAANAKCRMQNLKSQVSNSQRRNDGGGRTLNFDVDIQRAIRLTELDCVQEWNDVQKLHKKTLASTLANSYHEW